MNHLLDSDVNEDTSADREINLGAATILGIFFALALVCAAFFGFGYSMGRKSAQTAAAATAPAANPLTAANTAKPAAGFAPAAVHPAADPAASVVVPTSLPIGEKPSIPEKNAVAPADSRIAGDPIPARTQPPAPLPQPAVAPGGTFMVQIAAVSSQEIADIELAALRKYGYDVVIRHEPQDQLLHVQIGPYATRKDAEAMRQNVLAHGFNAIVK